MQSSEVWTGTAFAGVAEMLQLGMIEEAFATAKGIYSTGYEEIGYQYMTPEAWDDKGRHRALGYMRPLAIWAIQHAWEMRRDVSV